MKITTILIYLTYIGLIITLATVAFLGVIVMRKDFNTQEIEKNRFEGVENRSTTATFKLPMNLEVKYYFRIKEGEKLIDSYFIKIQKKFIPKAFLSTNEVPETDFPNPINGNLYSMPDSENYLYLQIPFSSIERALTIWKVYFVLMFSFLIAGIFITLKFLKNCNKGLYFIPQNSAFLRVISYLAIGFSIFDYVFQWLVYQEMNSKLEESFSLSLNSGLEFNWKYLIFSLFLVIIAQAFTEGSKLKEEQALTI